MTWWPGWNSISDSGWWSHFWFWFGIFCLFALGASEVVSHVYGLRKDKLVASQQEEKDRETEARRTAEADAFQRLQRQLSEADSKVMELQKQQTPRRLTEQQKRTLTTALSPFRGQKSPSKQFWGTQNASNFWRILLLCLTPPGGIITERLEYRLRSSTLAIQSASRFS
jgi:TolA-binding protein